jgi:hypothetical protein
MKSREARALGFGASRRLNYKCNPASLFLAPVIAFLEETKRIGAKAKNESKDHESKEEIISFDYDK